MPGLSFSYIVDYTESVMCVKTKESSFMLSILSPMIFTSSLNYYSNMKHAIVHFDISIKFFILGYNLSKARCRGCIWK